MSITAAKEYIPTTPRMCSQAREPMGYLARVVKDYENYIEVSQNQQRKFVSSKVNVVMLALTILSTLYAGYLFSLDFVSPGPNSYWQALLYGAVFFSAPLPVWKWIPD